MTIIEMRHGLPFVSVTLTANGQSLTLNHILLDTGSAATVFRTDDLKPLGISPQPSDRVHLMLGVGDGTEAVIERSIQSLELGTLQAGPFTIQMGLLNYQIEMNGIIGSDFLLKVGAILDFSNQRIHPLAK